MSDNKPARESGRKPADCEVRTFPFEVEDVRGAEGGRSKDFTIRGHAAVFNTWTDLGVFRERVAKAAFDDVLTRDPHVIHTIDHDPGRTLSSTRNKTLELRTDPKGLHFWSRVKPTSYALDLRMNLEDGTIDQSSFAFTVKRDEWNEREDGTLERTILEVGELYDVTTTAMGAYPTTDSQIAMRTLEHARALAGEPPDSPPADTTVVPAPDEPVADDGTDTPPEPDGAESEESTAAQEVPVARDGAALYRLKRSATRGIEEARAAQEQIEKEMSWR
jgi:Escherichia/Staphylococcus phage prohead protease